MLILIPALVLIRLLAVQLALADQPEPLGSSPIQKIERLFSKYQEEFKDSPAISAQELVSLQLSSKVVVIDVRTKKERQVSMIPRAIPMEEFERDERRYKSKKIIVYCTIGYRSGLYVEKLRAKGIEAYNLKGGVLAWAATGQSFVEQNGQTRRVHVYGKKWNLLPSGYEAVW